MKNTGAPSEQQFEDLMLATYGKRVYLYRIEDAKAAYGLNNRAVKTNARPSDYIVTANGDMFYAEVKSTVSPTHAAFKLRKGQTVAITRQIAAGGKYYVFVHSIHHGKWYKLPFHEFKTVPTWRWHDLEQYRIT